MYSTEHRPSRPQDFQGTDSLTFTPAEQQAIRAAEQAEGHETQRSVIVDSLIDLAAAVVFAVHDSPGRAARIIALFFGFVFLLGVLGLAILLAPSPSSNGRTETQRAQAQAQSQAYEYRSQERPLLGNTLPTQSDSRIEGRHLDMSAQEDIGALRESEPPAQSWPENVAKAEKVYQRELARLRHEGHWAAVEAESETRLYEEPSLNSSVLRHIASRSHYWANDTHRECDVAESLTWKIAVVESPTVESFQGFVCTPGQPSGAEKVHVPEPAQLGYQGHWTEVEAESETQLFEEPRLNSRVLRRIASRSRYWANDTHRECDAAEGLTWKIAVVESPTVEFFRGFVCTPGERSGAEAVFPCHALGHRVVSRGKAARSGPYPKSPSMALELLPVDRSSCGSDKTVHQTRFEGEEKMSLNIFRRDDRDEVRVPEIEVRGDRASRVRRNDEGQEQDMREQNVREQNQEIRSYKLPKTTWL